MIKKTTSRKLFLILNNIFMILMGLVCLLPFLHVASLSISSAVEAAAGHVLFWPVKFHTYAYQWILGRPEVWRSLGMSFYRVAIGFVVNMFLVLITAYPLSKDVKQFRWRTLYVWYFFVTMLFSGGLIPAYLIVKDTGIMNTIWALVLPGAVPVWNLILMLNFFRQIPRELEEAALIDGAGYVRTLFSIYIPVSMPAIATIALFTVVGHWNSWFDGIIYMNDTNKYPFQSYLRTLVLSTDLTAIVSLEDMQKKLMLSDRTIKSAQIILGTVPIILVYPFLQKYFTKGIIIGSVKG